MTVNTAQLYPYEEIEISRLARRYRDIEARQSEDLLRYFKTVDRGKNFPLTGYTVRLTVNPVWGHATLIAQLTGTLVDAATGKFSIGAARETVDGWPAGRWQYVLTGTDGTGSDREFLRGEFIVRSGAWV